MTEFFEHMNDDYARKHFTNGSFFGGAIRTAKRNSVAIFIFFVPLFLACLYGLIWSIGRYLELASQGQDDMKGVSIVICAFFAIFILILGFTIIMVARSVFAGRKVWIKKAAKRSKISQSDIERFEQQVSSSDTYILKLTAGLDRALASSITRDGLLTRDYVYIADSAITIFRVDGLRAAVFVDNTYSVGDLKHPKTIHNLSLALISENGAAAFADVTRKAGEALMELLKSRNNSIETKDGKLLSAKEYDELYKSIQQIR